jgi:putative Fe-S oxidoreductase
MHDRNELPDVLTFAGNGEPTGHPDFKGIIEDTINLRNRYCPKAKISVLSNSTYIFNERVREALMMVDNNILKVDTVDMDYIRLVDRPLKASYDIAKIIDGLKLFNGHVIIQTMFMKGKTEDGIDVDNTHEHFIGPWLEAVKQVNPQEVMIYTIDRETPDHELLKATPAELDAICDRVRQIGIPCTASY